MTVAIRLTPEQEHALIEAARRLNVPVDQLAAAALRDFVGQSEADFGAAATRIVEKNRELYRRLA